MMVELVLGDDHAVFVDALVTVLPQKGFAVLATAGSARGTVAGTRRHQPDVCLLDRYFADGDGLDFIEDVLAAGSPNTKVMVLTADRDALGMRRALKAGAAGYVNKMCGLDALAAAIRAVADGEVVTDLATAPTRRSSPATGPRSVAARLTARERECLGLLVAGAGTTTMAKQLGVSATTVRTHVQALLNKLGVHSRLEAASFALRHCLLDDAEVPRTPVQA